MCKSSLKCTHLDLKFSNFPGGGPPNPPSGSGRPPPTPTTTCHYVARNGGRAAILVPLTLEKVPVTKSLNKNPAYGSGANKLRFRDRMFINVMLLLQYIRIKYKSIRCNQSKYTSPYFLSCSIPPRRLKKFISVTMVMDTPPSHLYIAPMRAYV